MISTRELSLPAVCRRYTAPTCISRPQWYSNANGQRGSALCYRLTVPPRAAMARRRLHIRMGKPTSAMRDSIAQIKTQLRRQCTVRRGRLATAGPDAGARAARQLLGRLTPKPGAVVAGYWPIRDEIDPRPLMHHLADAGHPVVLPVTGRRAEPLLFRLWRPGDRLIGGKYGTMEPAPDRPAMDPDWILVPLLAFDPRGYRLGYGAGYYDATLEALRGRGVTAIGFAFAGQAVARVPDAPHDQPLDWVATETELIRCR